MAYYLTPAERRARAQALIEQRKNVVAYNKYLKQQKDYERQIAQAKLDEENRQKQIESQDFFTRAISTVGDISANVITGALKGLEGIYDLGAGIVGAVGGIFSEDFQNSVKSHIATDWVGKYIGDPLQELTKYSYTKNGGIIEGVASGIGQMLPAVAVTIATGGAGAPAAVAQMASLATLGASAAGNSTEQAFNDGADYYAGLGYGLASGAVEMATEKMFGGFGKLAGAGYFDNVTRSIAKQGFARVAKEAVEEGVEEIVSELANPALKAIYKGGEAFQEYGEADYWKGVGQAGLIGGLTSMAYGQSVGRVLHSSGKYADVNEALAEVDSLAQKARNLSETGKLYEKAKNGKVNSDTIHDSMVENLRLIEKTVQKVDETKRAKFIKQAHLTDVVNADGSIKPEFAMSRGLSDMIVQQSTEGGETAQSPLASQPKQYRTAFADERVLKEALDRGGATAFVGEMTSEQTSDFSDFTKVFGKLANKSNGFLKFVVGENVAGNSYIDTQTGTVVMGVDQFGKGTSGVDLANAVITSDMWQKSAIHEVKHSTEGAKQDTKLTQHLYEDNAVFAEARDSFLRRGYFNERVGNDSAKAGEYLDSLLVKVDEVMRSKPKNVSMEEHIAANLTSQEIQDYRTAQSEIAAIAAENVLGNESFIKKLLRKDTNIAQKVLNRIMDMKEAFASLKSKEARNAYTYLNKAEKLYLKAIEEVGAKFQKRRIIGIRRLEEGEEVDASPQSEYNGEEVVVQHSRKDSLINRTFPTYKEGKGTQANELSTRWAHRADIQAGDKTAVSFNGSWYLIEKFDDSEWGYQIIDKLTEKEYLTYEEEWNNGNRQEQSIQKGVSRFTSLDRQRNSSFRGESNNDVARSQQRGENQEVRGLGEEQSQRRETQSNRGGDSESRRSSKQGLKYSLPEEAQGYIHHDSAFYESEKGKKIASTMSMETCKQMIERTYYLINPNQYEESPIYKNAEHWLSIVGADEVALYVDNEYILQEKYLNKIPAVLDGDVYVAQIIEAYQDKALNGGNNKKTAKRLNVAEGVESNDSRFYAPQRVEEAKKLYEVANQKVTNANRSEVTEARAKILIFAHNRGAAAELGITQSELNKKLRSWSNYSANAREISQRINNGVAFANMWSGIENSSYLYNATIAEEDFAPLVGRIEGRSSEYERRYIANTMLALDTHIDYTGINFVFGENFTEKGVRGKYSDKDRTIRVRGGIGQQTVAREIGHAIDHQWARDVWHWVDKTNTGTNNGLSEGLNLNLITIPEVRQWVENYFAFIDNISDSGNIHSEYLQSKNEVFARFVAQFVDWTVQLATGRSSLYAFSDFNDKFTASQFVEFAKILQEKAKLDTKFRKAEDVEPSRKGIKFSRKEKDNVYHFINKLYRIEISWNEADDTYHLYCENSKGYLEYEGTLTEEQIESRFGEEFGLDLESKAIEKRGQVATIDRSWIEYYADEIKPSEKYDDDYLSEAKKQFGTTNNILLAGYINTDGSMLDFSGGYESRFIDHNDIDVIFDDEGGADAMYAYMRMGNIRLMPEAPSLEFNSKVEPTSQQYSTIKRAIDVLIEKHGKFYIEFSNDEGQSISNRQYERGVSTSQILEDIAYFYKNGKLPYQSDLSRFRYSRKPVDEPKRTYYHLSDGQIKKMLANSTRYKVYTKADAEGIINNVLQNYMSFGEKYGDISGKTKAQVIDMLWKGLNSAKPGYQMSVALNIADYIIQNSVLESLYGDMENYDVQQALDVIGALKPYLHNINLDSLKGEIKHKYDKDNSAYLLWGKRKGERGYGADQIAQELQERGIFIDAINEADIFFEIDAQYRNAVKALKKRAKEMLSESLPKEQQKALRQEIAREILRGFDYTGKSSQLAGVLDKYRKQIATLYDKLRDSKRHNQATNRLLDKVQKIKNWKTGAFVNSSKYRPKLFKGSIERLAMIKNRGNLNQSGTRRILAGLAEWYAKDNPILGYVDGENMGHYSEEIAAILQAVAQNQKPLTDEQVDLISFLQEKSGISDYKGLLEWYTKDNLKKGYSAEVKSLLRELASETTFTTEELIALDKAIGYFGNLIENHNKVIRNGKYVDAKPIAERYINTLRANKTVKVGWFGKFFDKVANNGKASYLQTFADPMTVARYMDKYENGFFTEMLQEIREGAIRADVLEMNIRLPLEEFLSKHKKYGKGVSKRTVTYRGVELPALDAFLLYMTLNREQALAGLAEAGFAFNDGKETKRVNGFAKGEDLTLDELRERAKAEQEDLYKQFTEEDKEYISIAEKIFNEDCKETKRETDMLRMGYSNVFDGYYVPIRRANSAVTVDTSTFFDEMNRVSNASFNKDTVQGARGELFIGGLDEVLDRHIHGISQYASLATVIDQYDILYNINMTEDANKPQTVRTESENTWAKGNDYFKKLISDVQGISPTRGGGSKLFGFLRGGYAKYQLGLNPKVWLTQLSSIFASSSILDYSSIVKGFGIKSPDVDDYCSLAAVRNNDNSAAMAQSVLDKVDKFGSALMKPIGKVDRFVIKRLFGACQVQVQKENGLKVGTKENKIKAGELLEKVILETQQNSMATERSAAMRSGSELMKTLTMFTADSMKVFGRVVDSFGEVSVLKHKIKETTDPKVKESLQAQLKAANKKARKSVTALAATAIFMALVAQAFRWLYDKDDDDESVLETMTVDAIGNLMGGLPLIKDIYAKLTEGYDLNNYAYSAINDLFDAFASVVNFSEGKPSQKVKNIVYAVGQIFGIPTRNVYNIFYGLTKRFSPTTAYEIDNVFYNKNYASDLQKAIDNDDEDMIATITGLMLDEKVGAIENATAKRELNSLVAAGYKVLPRSIGNSITYNGEEIALTSRQREQFKSVYSEANNALASLVEGKAYRSATEEVKAKAIAFIWDIYYNLAIEDLLGVDLETKNTLFAKAIDISSLAIIVATARGFEADTDKKGKVISGSRKAKVQGYVNSLGLKAAQKYMIMGYLGYSNKNGESQVRSYIQRLRLSKSEKEKLFEYSGYAA